ncbi:MAG: hypothetical protein K1X88_12890 [Nannocystaceae bacterium]|nr:hypothetical protein [Nannocystaceae bacterium]
MPPTRRTRALALGTFVLRSLAFAPAPTAPRASLGAVELRWDAPMSTCPDIDAIAADVRAGLAAPPREADAVALRVDARIEPTDDGRLALEATATSASGSESRRWVVDSCAVAAEVVAAVVTSAIEQAEAEPLPPLVPDAIEATDPPPPPPAEVREPTPPEPTPAPRPRRIPGAAVRVGGGVEFGGLPSAGGAIDLAAVLEGRFLRLEAIALYLPPRIAKAPQGASASIQIATAAVRGCGQLTRGRWRLMPGCTGLELGAALGAGRNVDNPRSDRVLWAAWQLGAGVAVHVHPRLRVHLDAHAAVPLGRASFSLRELGPVWQARTGGRVLLGLEIVLARPRRRPS